MTLRLMLLQCAVATITALACLLPASAATLASPAVPTVASPPAAAVPRPSPHEIRVAINIDPASSMPGNLLRNTSTDTILAHVVESLVALKGDMSIGPMLADRWDISPDGKTYTFHLRHGVTFQNGAPFTSADVTWSYRYDMTPSSSYYCRSSYDGRRGVKVLAVTTPDPYTVVFSLEQPSALFLPRMSDPRCPLAILNHESVDAQGKWIKPIGTGPYVFSAWTQGRDVLLTPFTGYRPRTETPSGLAGAKRGYDNVRFVVIPDEASQLSAFMAGQIDAMNVSENNLPEPSSDWSLVSGPGADPAALLMQTRDPLLADVRIRRAIALATDMPAITHAVSAGKADYNPSLIPVADAMYSKEEAVGYQKNLTEVKSLLEQAHYHGQVITLETNRRYAHMYSLAVYMQSLLSQAGINVRLQVVEWGTQISDFRAGRFQLMAFGYSARIDPALMYADVLGNKDRNPMLQWENPEASALLKTVETETDDADRQRIFAQLHALMLRDVPMLVFYHSPDLLLVSRHLHGVSSWPMRLKRFFNVTKD